MSPRWPGKPDVPFEPEPRPPTCGAMIYAGFNFKYPCANLLPCSDHPTRRSDPDWEPDDPVPPEILAGEAAHERERQV